MKKIGIFCGIENSFPFALINYINNARNDISADLVKIGFVIMEKEFDYDVIFDRVSHEVPMYQSVLKKIALQGTAVINNPYLKCAEDHFFQFSLANELKLKVPRTAIIPTKEHIEGTTAETYKNLDYPLNWTELFDYIGFPMLLKLNRSNAGTYSYKVYNPMEFFSAYDVTGTKQMIIQQVIDYTDYYRVFVVGKKHLKIINYDPNKPMHLRYSKEKLTIDPKHKKNIEKIATDICIALDLDVNAIDFGIFNSEVYLLDFYNTAPQIESVYFSEDDYNWLVFTIGDYLISLAEKGKNWFNDTPWRSLINIKKTKNG